jgi:hypothetical protein
MSQITLSNVPLANESDEHFVHLISNLLTPTECSNIIAEQSPSLISVSGTYSTRLRHVYDNEDLSDRLWDRLEQFYETTKVTDSDGQIWTAKSLNSHFRYCKYKAGDAFGPHTDGARLISLDTQSFMTVNIYLADVPSSAGGATRVPSYGDSPLNFDEKQEFEVLGHMQPREGMAAVFRDTLFHDGEVLGEGEKYLLRTDVLFSRDVPFQFDALFVDLAEEQKAQKALDLALRLEDGGNREEAVRWYRKAFKLDPRLERGA